MQPKFTQRNVGYFFAKIIAVALFLVSSSQLSLAQQRGNVVPGTDNDAGLPNKPIVKYESPTNPQAICSTYVGALTAGDPTLPGNRFFRDGVASTCAGKACPGVSTPAGCSYDILTWTNPLGTPQCVTVAFTNQTSGFVNFIAAYNGAITLNPLCPAGNFLGDVGSSPAQNATLSFSFTAPGNATVNFIVMSTTAASFSSYTFTVDAAVCTGAPCAGTPNPGNTISSVSAACPTTAFNLTLQNFTPGAGVNYQWQTAPAAAGPWTNGGPNNSTWARTQTVSTWYRCIVSCGALSGTSNPVFVGQNPFYNCYCNSSAGNAADEDIFNVSFGTLNNSSNCATTAPGPGSIRNRYSNYKEPIAPSDTGRVVTGNMNLSVQIGTCGGNFSNAVGVWIDYDHNGVFDDPAERAYRSVSTTVGAHTETAVVNIPPTALFGFTGMRVINVEAAPTSILPCAAYTWGETEDYLIDIQPCVPLPISGVTVPSTVTGECSGIIAIPVNTGTGSFPSFSWEYRVNSASPWILAVDGGLGGVITGATTGTLVLINVPSTLNGYQFRSLVSNPCSAFDVTNVATIIVGPLVARVTPTSASICTGTILQLSLQSPQATFNSGTVNVNVPDFLPNGIVTNLPVSGIPGAATITEVIITWNMTHTWVGDMVMNLRAPNGQTINLIGLLDGGTGSNGTANFVNTSVSSDNTKPPMSGAPAPRTGVFRADRYSTIGVGPNLLPTTTNNWALLTPTGASANGTWTLGMADLGPADLGVLQNWSITISYGAPITGIWSQSPAPAPPNQFARMWLNAGASVPYTGGPASAIWVNPLVHTVYTVVASTTSPACTSAPVQIPVTVAQPLVSITNPAAATVCAGGTVSFSTTALSAGGAPYNGPFTYVWEESRNNGLTWSVVTNGGVYSGATTNTLTLTGVTRAAPVDMNLFRYRVTVSAPPCPGSMQSTSALLTVLALPVVTISATDLALTPGQTSTITATSVPGPHAVTPNWVWTRNGVTIAGANTGTVIADIDHLGVYRVSVTDVNGCRNSSNSILIESEVSDRLWIYPNPTTGKFQVRLYYSQVFTEIRRVIIFNALGQKISEKDFPLSNITPHYAQLDFDLSNHAGGVYVVKVYDRVNKSHIQGLLIKQ